ncbi:MAG: protein arginine kinase [Parachlamydiaceae bacterium]|nr:protein arginine kinase [Parachlamydiaceae bacterium]
MKSNKKPTTELYQQRPWDKNDNSVWLASTISFCRNIEKFKFPGKLEGERQKQIVNALSKALLSSEHLKDPLLMRADELSHLQKEFLVEHFLSQQSFQSAHSNEAFLIDKSGEFLASMNIHDHVNLQLIDCRGELESTWNRLLSIDTALGKQIAYAFSQKYGFLSADFNNCGTGLNVAVFLQVPGLVHIEKIDDVLEKITDDSLTISGIQGNPTEIIGDILMVQNNYTLGVTEENIIASLRAFTTKILIEENGARSKILSDGNGEIKDKVSRAFGILMHSYQIEAIEALNALSLLKLGLELKWLEGITLREINGLFFNCRRAHLMHQCGEDLKQEEILHKRAEFIHASLKNVKLTI